MCVDADRNRSATAYAARGMLPFEVVPVEAAAKATRAAQVIITDGQASSHEELKNLSAGADLVLLPTTPQARSVELTIELSSILRSMDTLHAALLVVDSRKQRLANDARQTLDGFQWTCWPLKSPCWRPLKAEVKRLCLEAVDDRGRADLRRMGGWSAYCAAAVQIRERLMATDATDSMIMTVIHNHGSAIRRRLTHRQRWKVTMRVSPSPASSASRQGVVTVSLSSSIRK